MPLAAEIREFLDFFCDGPANVDYATLIDGPWGCGKTFFLKKYLREREEKGVQCDPLVGAPYLYVSLYGVASMDQLRDNFFAQAHPLLSSPAAKIVGNTALSVVGRYTGLKALLPGVRLSSLFPRLDARVLVFDDLERAMVPVVTALGWINEFVETGDLRVVVIGSQSEIPTAQQEDYALRKEKVIGRTILYEADPAEALTTFIDEIREQAVKQTLSKNADLILDLARARGTPNLRSLRSALGNYLRLVTAVDQRIIQSDEAARQLLAYILAVEIEFRRGLKPEELKHLMTPRGGGLYGERKESDKYREIQAGYPDVEWSYPIVPSDDVADLLVSGLINVDRINEAVATHQLFASPEDMPSWRRIMVWPRRRAAYLSDRADLLDDLAHHRITHPGAILHVTGTLLWLDSLGDSLFDDLEVALTKYIDELDAAGAVDPAIAVFEDRPPDAWAGYSYSFNDHPLFAKIREHLHPAVSRSFDKQKCLEAPELLAKLQDTTNNERFKLLYENSDEHSKYAGVPILHHIDPKVFVEVIMEEDTAIKTALTAIVRRYDFWNNECELLREKPWLDQVEVTLRDRIAKLDPPFARAFGQSVEPSLKELHFALGQMVERCKPPAEPGEANAVDAVT